MTAYMLAIKHATAPFMIENSIESLVKLGPAIEHWFEWAVRLLAIGKAVKFKDAASLDEIARWASRDRRAIKGSVVIAAGSCDDAGDTAVRGHKEMLTKAFADYNGNIISGGTHSGIGGIVGDIQEAYPTKVYTMGYVPAKLPSGCEIDTRYCDTRTSEGSRFSPLQPLQYWADLLRSGIEPASVKLLGVGGNSLALFEYQLALILGAKVGLAGAGDGSHVMNRDELTMSTMSGAIVFPSDAYVLRSFVGTGFPGLPDRIRENVAKALHQTYMGNDSGHLTMSMESMVELEELPPELKESNRRAVDHIVQKLNEIGCSLEHIEKGDVRLIDFSDGEIEIMAEMEHARWLAEKFEL
jgi:hypothetical protein